MKKIKRTQVQEASNWGIAKDNVYLKRKEGVSNAICCQWSQRKRLIMRVYAYLLDFFLKKKLYLLKFQRLHALDLISHEIKEVSALLP